MDGGTGDAQPWACPHCTYSHEGSEAGYLSCAACGGEKRGTLLHSAAASALAVAATEEPAPPAAPPPNLEDQIVAAATIVAAQTQIDSVLARSPDRSAQAIEAKLGHESLASRIAQQRQQRSLAKMAARESRPGSADAERSRSQSHEEADIVDEANAPPPPAA